MFVQDDIVGLGALVLDYSQRRFLPLEAILGGSIHAPALVASSAWLGADHLVPHLVEPLFPILHHTGVVQVAHFPGLVLDEDGIPGVLADGSRGQSQSLGFGHQVIVVKKEIGPV